MRNGEEEMRNGGGDTGGGDTGEEVGGDTEEEMRWNGGERRSEEMR